MLLEVRPHGPKVWGYCWGDSGYDARIWIMNIIMIAPEAECRGVRSSPQPRLEGTGQNCGLVSWVVSYPMVWFLGLYRKKTQRNHFVFKNWKKLKYAKGHSITPSFLTIKKISKPAIHFTHFQRVILQWMKDFKPTFIEYQHLTKHLPIDHKLKYQWLKKFVHILCSLN